MGSMFTQLPTDWELAQPILEQILQVNAGTVLKVAGTTNKRPSPPQSIGGTVDQQQVTLTWTMPDASSDITGWRVYKDNENNMIQSVKDPNTLSAIIKVAVTTAVGFWISSVNAAGRESIKVQAIATPKGINLALGVGKVALDTQVADGPVNFGRTPVSNYGAATPSGKVTGFQVLTNADFQNGTTNWNVYDNNASGSVGISLVADVAAPGGMGKKLKIVESAVGLGPTPGLGGFYYSTVQDTGGIFGDGYHEGDTYIIDLVANIPTGYTINFATNSLGGGGSYTWLSSQAGTGNWQHYIVRVVVGSAPSATGAFPFFYLTGTDGVTWYVGQLVIIDIDQPNRFGGRVTSVGGDGTMVDWSTGVSSAGVGNIVYAGNVRTYLNSSPGWGFYGSPSFPVENFGTGGTRSSQAGSDFRANDTGASGREYSFSSRGPGNANMYDWTAGAFRTYLNSTPQWGFFGAPSTDVEQFGGAGGYRITHSGLGYFRANDTQASGREYGWFSGGSPGPGISGVFDQTAGATRTYLNSSPQWGFYGSPAHDVEAFVGSTGHIQSTGTPGHLSTSDTQTGGLVSEFGEASAIATLNILHGGNTRTYLPNSANWGFFGAPSMAVDIFGQTARVSATTPDWAMADTTGGGRQYSINSGSSGVGYLNLHDDTGSVSRTFLNTTPQWGFFGSPSTVIESTISGSGTARLFTNGGTPAVEFALNNTNAGGREYSISSQNGGNGLYLDETAGSIRTTMNTTPALGLFGTPGGSPANCFHVFAGGGEYNEIENASANTGWRYHYTGASGREFGIGSGAPAVSNKFEYDWTAAAFRNTIDSSGNVDLAGGTPNSSRISAAGGNIADTSGNLILKNISSPTPSTLTPTTTSGTFAVIPEMTTTITTKGNKVLVVFTANFNFTSISGSCYGNVAVFKDGSQISQTYQFGTSQTASNSPAWAFAISYIDSPTAASHTYDIRWNSNNGFTLQSLGTARALQVTELG